MLLILVHGPLLQFQESARPQFFEIIKNCLAKILKWSSPSLRVVPREGGLDNRKYRTGLWIVFGLSLIHYKDNVNVRKLLIGDSVSVNSDGDRGNNVLVLQAWKKYSILYSGKQHGLQFLRSPKTDAAKILKKFLKD